MAAAFSVMLFIVFATIGTGVLALLRTKKCQGDLLLGPALGIACVAIPTVALNEAGLAVQSFGWILTAVLLAIGIFGIWKNVEDYDWRLLLPFGLILLASFGLTGWPLFLYDFHWLSYANEDMANYVTSAQRLLQHPYFEAPDARAFAANRNYPMFFWFLDDLGNERFGVDATLAWAASLGRLTSFEGFMPTILAFHLCVVSATAGLVYRASRLRPAALVTSVVTGCSSLLSFGVDYQLIAQSAGLALVCASVAVLCSLPVTNVPRAATLREAALAVIVVAGTTEIYPEVLPFVLVPVAGVLVFALAKHRVSLRPIATWSVGIAFGAAIVLNLYLRNATWVLLARLLYTGGPQDANKPMVFPFFLIPSGFANYFGIYPLTQYPPEPILSLGILGGFLFAAVTAYATLREMAKGAPVAYVSAVMLSLAAVLFWKLSDFALYKIAMYSQPFVAGVLSLWWCDLWRSRISLPARASQLLMIHERAA